MNGPPALLKALVLSALAAGLLAGCQGNGRPASPTRQLLPLSAAAPIEEITARVRDAPNNFSTLQGVVESESFVGTFRQQVWVQQPERWRVEFSGDLNELGSFVSGDILVSDGLTMWLIQPDRRRYCVGPSGGEFSEAVLSGSASAEWPPAGLDSGRVVGEGMVAGRRALQIALGPPVGDSDVWVDALTGAVLRFERRGETYTVRRGGYTQIAFDEELDENLFRYDPPPGMREMPCEQIVNY